MKFITILISLLLFLSRNIESGKCQVVKTYSFAVKQVDEKLEYKINSPVKFDRTERIFSFCGNDPFCMLFWTEAENLTIKVCHQFWTREIFKEIESNNEVFEKHKVEIEAQEISTLRKAFKEEPIVNKLCEDVYEFEGVNLTGEGYFLNTKDRCLLDYSAYGIHDKGWTTFKIQQYNAVIDVSRSMNFLNCLIANSRIQTL